MAMPEEHAAVTFLLAAHDRAERLAQASAGGRWVVAERADCDCCDVVRNATGGLVTTADLDDAPLIAEHSNPTAVLARVAAERDILAEHADDYGSCTCGRASEETTSRGYAFFEAVDWPCRTVLGLAKAWGWEEAT